MGLELFLALSEPMKSILELDASIGGKPKASQSWADWFQWEEVLNAHPELRAIVEIGTHKGGMSLFLKLQAIQRGMNFYTFDISDAVLDWDFPLCRILELSDDFTQCDVFEDNFVLDGLFENDRNFPMVLLCDGGNKMGEYNRFAPRLRPGSIVALHDWGMEAWWTAVDHQLTEPVYHPFASGIGSLTRFFIRR